MLSHDDYTVGWVCALPLEMTAAIAMLDETHVPLSQPESDNNGYALGSIAEHNVVIVCLPTGIYGTVSATTVVSQMLPTFPRLRFALMVGIGGGIPGSGHDIRLGDVVVSKPTGSCGGVVQYDFGKALQGGGFEQTGSLNNPPQVLLTHMSLLQATMAESKDGFIYSLVQGVLDKRSQLVEGFGCPGPENDVLFDAVYPHDAGADSNGTCKNCDPKQRVKRDPRKFLGPRVHYGTIASGSQVVKDSKMRDRLAKELNIMCFEMEAAGMMNLLPCLVVRGICDYSDSHKIKDWQGYAALTAAAYSKLLLSTLKPRILHHINNSTRGEMTPEKKACLNSLFLSDPEDDKSNLKRRRGERAPDTCSWIFDTEELQDWLGLTDSTPRSSLGFVKTKADICSNVLWLHGNPGTGKSTMVVTLAEELPKKPYFDNLKTLAYFLCDSSSAHRRTAVSILRVLLYQLIKGQPELIELLFEKYQERHDGLFTSFDALWSLLMDVGRDVVSGDKYCIIDAIDECEPESQGMLLTQINQTFKRPDLENDFHLHILVTSRPYPEIGRYLSHFRNQNLSQYDQVAKDLKLLIKSKVEELSTKNRYSEKVAAEVAEILEDKAEGTFLWVGIACTELESVQSRVAVKTLKEMPRGLHSLYRNLLDTALTHSGENSKMILHMMSVVAISQQPLSVTELSVACDLYPDEDEESRLNFTHDDIDLCRLMVVVQDGIVRLLHKSVKDFLLRKGGEDPHLVDDMMAHATLAYRCLDTWLQHCEYLLKTKEQKVLPNIDFLPYAAQYWGVHAHHAMSEFRILKQHERFFRAKSPERIEWVDRLEFILDLPSNHEGFTTLHMAALFGIRCLVDFAFEEMRESFMFGKWLKVQPRYDDAQYKDYGVPSPLEVAATHGQSEVMDILLKRKTDKMIVSAQVMEVAAINEDNGEEMMKLLLSHKAQVNESVFIAAAGNRSHGGAIMSMLLDRGWGLTSQGKRATADAKSGRLAELTELVNTTHHAGGPTITQKVINTAAKNRGSGTAIMTKILSKLGHELLVDDEAMEEMCANLEPSAFQTLLHQKEGQIPLTLGLILSALRNASAADEMMAVLLDQCNTHEMPGQDILDNICGRVGTAVINKFLDGQEKKLTLTGANVMSVAWDSKREEVLEVLLERCLVEDWSHLAIPICINFSPGIVRKILDTFEAINVTTHVIRAIAGRGDNHVQEVMKVILRHPQMTLAEEEISYMCQLFDVDVIQVLLEHQVINITLDLLTSMDLNGAKKDIMMTLLQHGGGERLERAVLLMICKMFDWEVIELLAQRQDVLEIDHDLINACSSNKEYGHDAMSVIIRQSDPASLGTELISMICRLFSAQVVDQLPKFNVCSEIVHAAANNFFYGREVVSLLFRRHSGRVQLDHGAIAAVYDVFADDLNTTEFLQTRIAAPSHVYTENELADLIARGPEGSAIAFSNCDANTIAAMLDRYKNCLTAGEAILSAASNEFNGKDVVQLLLRRFKGQYQLEEAMFKAAAANEFEGTGVMEVLLDWEESSSAISENVVKVAASNQQSGYDLVVLLICRCEWDIFTDEVLKAAMTNTQSGRQTITLLVHQSTESTIHITESLIRIASATHADDVLAMLFSSQRINLQIQQKALELMCLLFNFRLVDLLLEQYKGQVKITDEVIAAAAANSLYGDQMLDYLLKRQNPPSPREVELALEAAAAADEVDTVAFLLNEYHQQETVSEDLVCAAAGNRWRTSQVLSMLLRANIPITEKVLIAAARGGSDTFSALLRWRDELPITDAVLQAASDNECLNEHELGLLRQRYSAQVGP
ncbi:uncharacterized protein BDV14DRAFT_53210 [Aspergillus stella-maris]|uniref:uncharacterized protein n=1 Tax=Aspergillus stella-maris TaxID=1810926 RepID=UPI003CCD2BED